MYMYIVMCLHIVKPGPSDSGDGIPIRDSVVLISLDDTVYIHSRQFLRITTSVSNLKHQEYIINLSGQLLYTWNKSV